MLKVMWWLQILAVIFFCAGTAAAQTPGASPPPDSPVLSMHNIHIDKVKKEIRIPVRLAINEGILEYLLVGEHGKTYESVFKVAGNKPSELNFALLLLGAEPL
ncbi:MAG: hypothetical protein GY697_20610, partial [Desulfobacterales bacterium]|nr:hypothetical protein [Desulfobacterales bacterium]